MYMYIRIHEHKHRLLELNPLAVVGLHFLKPMLPILTHLLVFFFDIRLPPIKRNIPLNLLHPLQRLRIIPRRVLDFRLVGCDGVVRGVAFVGTVGVRGCGREVRSGDAGRWELLCVRRGEEGDGVGGDGGKMGRGLGELGMGMGVGGGRDRRRCSRRRLPRYLFGRRRRR